MTDNQVPSDILKKLAVIVGPQNLTTAREDLLCYSYDSTAQEYIPDAVIFPGSSQEISSILQLADASSIVVVPRGAGTGMTGGALPVKGGLVMVLTRLNRILEIDKYNQVAVVEPGVITGHLKEEAKKSGLFYPPDPSSFKFCTIGGNVAECAGGASAVKYGVTRDYTLGLEVVLPDGRILNTGVKTAKGVVGYDLTRLFVGSEGTLGILTKIILKLLPHPACRATFQVSTASMQQATSLVARILSSHQPCTLEFMDKTALHIVSTFLPNPLPTGTKALLLIEVDGDAQTVALQSDRLMKFLQAEPGLIGVQRATNEKEAEALWSARRSISPASFELKPHKINEDVVVPRTKIPDLVAFTELLSVELGITIFTFGHAGDGNIHVNIMLDRENSLEKENADIAKKRLFAEVLRLSGTLSGEHGVGITKADYLPLELDETALSVMRNLKKLFDPKNILNPGKIFPEQSSGKNN